MDRARLGYQLGKKFHLAVEEVSFDVHPGDTIILLGPSGCGKSTLLKAIGGYLPLSGGRFQHRDGKRLTPGPDRAFVFQEFDQLFPWRTVLDNVAYPLRRNGRSKREADDKARHYVHMMGLTAAAERFPHQLSGGMKQRVAIARAFALEPDMLLMDEPFGSLDALTRAKLQAELNKIASQTQVTILFVTHSIEEAILLGTRVVVLSHPPSRVREIIEIPSSAKEADSQDYLSIRLRLRRLLNLEGEEEADVAPFE